MDRFLKSPVTLDVAGILGFVVAVAIAVAIINRVGPVKRLVGN